MFGRTNTLIREIIRVLKDPDNWNQTGGLCPGKTCIVMCSFGKAVDHNDWGNGSHTFALRAIRQAIEARHGLSRGKNFNRRRRKYEADIIAFNDHRKTTHADLMSVLYQAEKYTRPFWRGRMPS